LAAIAAVSYIFMYTYQNVIAIGTGNETTSSPIHQQLLFSTDVCIDITLQLLHPALSLHEDATTMEFIDHVSNM